MSDQSQSTVDFDYSKTLFLPKTDFPMRAGLPKKEVEIIARWDQLQLYQRLRETSIGRTKYLLHDGPPYANGHLHIGHALNKVLKDMIVRSLQMNGYDSNYIPGWDCHGLPIEWKIEEQYRAKGQNKDDVPINEFRKECRDFAANWIEVQAAEFRRLGVEGDFSHPYTTMAFTAEAKIAEEIMKFATSDQLYRGSKPVMWSVVEKTALAEAEVEYENYESDTIWVKFPVTSGSQDLIGTSIVIWTTTPWTIPSNRAISYSDRIAYGLYEVLDAAGDNWAKVGEQFILADALAEDVFAKARVNSFKKCCAVLPEHIAAITCAHPLLDIGYDFHVPLLEGDHVTDDTGTGFVHTAPGHGRDDFEIWMANSGYLREQNIDTRIPYAVDGDGFLTNQAPGFEGRRVINDKGKKGDANKAVIEALVAANALIARGRLKHQYPHSWRSKKPIIFRNTPQWFVHMDQDLSKPGDTLRQRALQAIEQTRFVPEAGQNRLRSMIETRPDWVLSRQRAWGVPIAIFVKDDGEILNDPVVNERILKAFNEEGADAWFAEGAAQRFLGKAYDPNIWCKVDDILDVWFDSGSTHAFVLEQRSDLQPKRGAQGGADKVIYLEGSDQHRGWFHSSLLESCGTRGSAPYDEVVTHGFVMDEDGRKMSKSLGNIVTPQDVIKQSGADILRLWVATSDYAEDLRIGPEILKTNIDVYRKLRNTIRWMLGTLAHHQENHVPLSDMPEIEQLMLHRLSELDKIVRQGYQDYDYKRVMAVLTNFMTLELSAFYFDIRKDVLYCDPISSGSRKAGLHVIALLFDYLVKWLAPILPFTMEEAWLTCFGEKAVSVHLEQFPNVPDNWHNDVLAKKWAKIRTIRRVVTGALEIERREKRIGSSLETAPVVYIADPQLIDVLEGLDFAEICITSQITLSDAAAPENAFCLDDVDDIAVVPALARGRKCARSWKILPEVGSDPDYPDITLRDAEAMRQWTAALV